MYVIKFWIDKPSWTEALMYVCHLINRLPSSEIGG